MTKSKKRAVVVVAAMVAALIVRQIAIWVFDVEFTWENDWSGLPDPEDMYSSVDLSVRAVALTAGVSALLGWAWLALIERFKNAIFTRIIWISIAAVVLLVSLVLPALMFYSDAMPARLLWTLIALHVSVFVAYLFMGPPEVDGREPSVEGGS